MSGALRQLCGRRSSMREKVVLATVTYIKSPEMALAALLDQFVELGIDYIDVLFWGWIGENDGSALQDCLQLTPETLAWLQEQRITVEDWSQGIRVDLLTKKLKEHLFGDTVDAHYISNRNDYKRVALSQILVRELPDALKVAHALREENASFCALALE